MTRSKLPVRLVALAHDRSGASAIVIGLSMTALLGFVGLAVDAGVWYADRRAAQGAADAAAYSGAIDIAAGDTVTGARAAAKAITAQYGLTDGAGGVTVTVNSPPATGPNISTTGALEVTVNKSEPLFFAQFFVSSEQISARSVAVAGSTGGKYCVLALNPHGANSVLLNGSAIVDMSNCGLQVNSTSSSALSVSGLSTLKAKNLSVVGNYSVNNGGHLVVSGATVTGAATVTDPYASVTAPTPGACLATGASYKTTVTLNPGTYCEGMTLTATAKVTLNPGVYLIAGQTFAVNGGATLTGTGVTIILTNKSGGAYAVMSVDNGANVNLSAPTSGSTAGVAIYGDRRAPYSTQSINGGTNFKITGAVYFPTSFLSFNGNTVSGSQCTQLIAYDIAFDGNAYVSNTCTGTGVTGIGSAGTSLVE